MTMLITKFHKLIGNKLFWIIFSGLVVISFVFWGMQVPDQDDVRSYSSPGTLGGKPVDIEELQQAKFSSYLSLLLQARQPIPYTSDLDSRITPLAWRRLISLREARDLGLTAGNDEVAANLAQQPLFSPNGTFDKALYRRFVTQELPLLLQSSLSMGQFEAHLRDEMSIDKLARMISETTLVAPFDVRRTFERLNEQYEVEYVTIRPEDVEEGIRVTDEDVRAFFDRDPSAFELPERVSVQYVAIRADDFMDGVSIGDARIEEYYNANLSRYELVDTNAVADPLAEEANAFSAFGDTNADSAAQGFVLYRPLEEVEDEIRDLLRLEAARLQAVKVANDFVYTLTPDRYGKAPKFIETAERMGLTVESVEPFALRDAVPAFADVGDELREQAFKLNPNPDEHFSNPVTGTNAVYLLSLKERIPPRVPDFEDVADEVEPAARAAAVADAMRAMATKLREAVENAESDGAAFSSVAADFGLTSTNTGSFSLLSGLEEFASARELRFAVMSLNMGEVSEPIEVPEGYVVVYVKEFTPADPSPFAGDKSEFERRIHDQYHAALFGAWQDQLLEDAEFSERTSEEEADDEETEPDADDDAVDDA